MRARRAAAKLNSGRTLPAGGSDMKAGAVSLTLSTPILPI
jgi:hypothetical protein